MQYYERPQTVSDSKQNNHCFENLRVKVSKFPHDASFCATNEKSAVRDVTSSPDLCEQNKPFFNRLVHPITPHNEISINMITEEDDDSQDSEERDAALLLTSFAGLAKKEVEEQNCSIFPNITLLPNKSYSNHSISSENSATVASTTTGNMLVAPRFTRLCSMLENEFKRIGTHQQHGTNSRIRTVSIDSFQPSVQSTRLGRVDSPDTNFVLAKPQLHRFIAKKKSFTPTNSENTKRVKNRKLSFSHMNRKWEKKFTNGPLQPQKNLKNQPFKKILRKKFSWKNYPELEAFLVANREEYLRHSAMNYTTQQKQYNNRLTERLLELASENGYVFDEEDFSFVTVRDRIRCYFKSYVQSSRKRGIIIGYAARRAGLVSEKELEESAGIEGKIVVPAECSSRL
jgi:hypothetical protein